MQHHHHEPHAAPPAPTEARPSGPSQPAARPCCHGAPPSPPPATVQPPAAGQAYTCPMHPEVVQDGPGDCPICGMALEPRTVQLDAGEDVHVRALRRRFWVSAALTLPLFVAAMAEMIVGERARHALGSGALAWVQLALATPVVAWGGWPFFARAWTSVRTLRLNMYTLIGLGVAVAYLFSLVATLFPAVLPPAFLSHGSVPLYFESAAVIVVLVLLGELLELRARSR